MIKPEGIVFDLDGTLVDNNSYHIEAWKEFYKKIDKQFSHDEYMRNINGRISKVIFPYLMQREMEEKEIMEYDDEKESLYRELYGAHMQPIKGLIDFLEALQEAGYKMAIATSGLPPNIEFMFNKLPLRKYFSAVVNASHITNGKPHPEIFERAAKEINADPNKCIAFEDSIAGISSAKAAGMRVVGLTTTHSEADLTEADMIIKDYTEISTNTLLLLMQKQEVR